MKTELNALCVYAGEKISVSRLTRFNYVSTENMRLNKGGVEAASALPRAARTQRYQRDDVLVSNIRPYFKKIWAADRDGGCSNDVLVFRAREGCYPPFLYYLLSDDAFFDYATATARGTKMPRGDKAAIMQYEVPALSQELQMRIADILAPLDQKIQCNRQISGNLEQQIEAVFQKLFLDCADSGWPMGTLGELGTIAGGGTPSKSKPEYYTAFGVPWITPKDLSMNRAKFISRGAADISELGLKRSGACVIPEGSVLFSSRAPIGYTAIAAGEVTTNQGFKSVVPKPEIGTAYIYYFLKHHLPEIERMASGSTFKEVSARTMRSVPAVIPDRETLARFNAFCAPVFGQQRALEEQNQALAALRSALLPRLLSGQIGVPGV